MYFANTILDMRIFVLLIIIASFFSCGSQNEMKVASKVDIRTQSIIDRTVDAMGGYDKYNDINYVSWTFFGRRDLLWDKKKNRVRVDSPGDSSIYILNMDDMSGRVLSHGQEVEHRDSLSKYLNIAKRIWINDSYWLVMPFKLEDPGVTTQYVRRDTTLTGRESEVLALTFDKVGVTPQNKYEVYVDTKSDLIMQWSFFREADQKSDPAIWPWDNYKEYKGVLLSGNRSDGRGPSDIKVYDQLSDRLFQDFVIPEL